MTVNKVVLLGRLGQQPQLKRTPRGEPYAMLSVATSRARQDKAGERRQFTEWHRVVVWAEHLLEAVEGLGKGATIYVEGALATRSWEGAGGERHYTTEGMVKAFKGRLLRMDRRPGERIPDPEDADDYGSGRPPRRSGGVMTGREGIMTQFAEENVRAACTLMCMAERLAGAQWWGREGKGRPMAILPQWTAWLLMEKAGVPRDLIAYVSMADGGELSRRLLLTKALLLWPPYAARIEALARKMPRFSAPQLPAPRSAKEAACRV